MSLPTEGNEHDVIVGHIRAVLATISGKEFIKYLFKYLDVAVVPDIGLPDNILRDQLGIMRAGTSIYKLICAADPDLAAQILSKVEKERNYELGQD